MKARSFVLLASLAGNLWLGVVLFRTDQTTALAAELPPSDAVWRSATAPSSADPAPDITAGDSLLGAFQTPFFRYPAVRASPG